MGVWKFRRRVGSFFVMDFCGPLDYLRIEGVGLTIGGSRFLRGTIYLVWEGVAMSMRIPRHMIRPIHAGFKYKLFCWYPL